MNSRDKKSKSRLAKGVEQRLRDVQRAAAMFKQASDPSRVQVVLALAHGEKHVGAICVLLNSTQPAISHHLALMRHGGLVVPRREGKNVFYSLTEFGEELLKVLRRAIG